MYYCDEELITIGSLDLAAVKSVTQEIIQVSQAIMSYLFNSTITLPTSTFLIDNSSSLKTDTAVKSKTDLLFFR